MGIDNPPGPRGSAYISGWFGYVEKDLRSVLDRPVDGAYSREYCGERRASPRAGRQLRKSLVQTVKNSAPEDVYTQPDCAAGRRPVVHGRRSPHRVRR